jgi:hypothetical protein
MVVDVDQNDRDGDDNDPQRECHTKTPTGFIQKTGVVDAKSLLVKKICIICI